MAFTCDPTTRAELDASPSKLADTAVLQAALGNNRRIICKRDGNANAADPWTTGTVFRDVGSTGNLKVAGGRVIGLGRIKGTTVSQAADVSTGASVLRIQGNGRWIQVTLGGPGSNADVVSNGFFTATNGLALKPDFAISGKMFKPSGTGPAAPELDADAPTAFRVISYIDAANPVIAGTAQLSVRDLDMVMDHPQIASEMGDVRMQRCADGTGVVLGTGGDCFRIAGTLLAMNGIRNAEVPGKPVYQFLSHIAPHGRWPSAPFRKDFNIADDTLILPPHKIELLRANGSVIHVIEMYSTQVNGVNGTGKAINLPTQNQNYNNGPVQAWFTCNMQHFWQSHKIVRNSKATHYIPGVEAEALHPSNCVAFDANPQVWPVMTGQWEGKSFGAWRMAPKWSKQIGTPHDVTPADTWFTQPARDNYVTQLIGWGYEPGATGQHTWFMSPGGPRHDRSCWPHVIVSWASDPNGVRVHGNTPLEELKDHWLYNYFNEGCHYHQSATLERGISIDKKKVLAGLVAYNDTYYNGGNENFVPDIQDNAIRLLTAGNKSDSGPLDKYGRRFTNEYQRDNQHSYSNGALGVYVNNSPAHVLSARATFNSHVLCSWGMTRGHFDSNEWLTRQHAWHMWQHANQWVATSSDERTISRNELEVMWENFLHRVHDSVMPKYLSGTDIHSQGIRNCGIPMTRVIHPDGTKHGYNNVGADSKLGYMGQALLLMKQSGSFEAMRNRSVKCREILDLHVICLSKATATMLATTDGQAEGAVPWDSTWMPARTPIDEPLGEVTWLSSCKRIGNEDWLRYPDGAIGSYPERYTNTMHLRAQCVWIIRDYFPEFNLPDVPVAAAKLDNWYSIVENGWKATPKTNEQWHWRYSYMGKFKKAPQIGAPT